MHDEPPLAIPGGVEKRGWCSNSRRHSCIRCLIRTGTLETGNRGSVRPKAFTLRCMSMRLPCKNGLSMRPKMHCARASSDALQLPSSTIYKITTPAAAPPKQLLPLTTSLTSRSGVQLAQFYTPST
jgi:hypothetical protein